MKISKPQHKKQQQSIIKSESSIMNDIEKKPTKEIPESIQSAVVLMDDNYKRRKTVLTNKQIAPISTLDTIAQLYDIAWLQKFLDNYAEWRTSGDKGRGRQDVTDIFKFSSLHEQSKTKELLNMIGRGR